MPTPVRIDRFGGEVPKLSSRLLPEVAAQRAENCKLASGELRPLRKPEKRASTTKAAPVRSIFRAVHGAASAWLAWGSDVDVVKLPLPLDATPRWAYTGDGEPRLTTLALATAGGANDYPKQFYALGTPAPVTAPTVTPSGGTGTAISRAYCYSFVAVLEGKEDESAPSPVSAVITGKVDDTWAITNMDAVPPNTGDITALTYTGLSVTLTTTNRHFNRVGEKITLSGVTTVANVNGTWALTAVDLAAKTMTFSVAVQPTGTYNNTTDTTDTWGRVAPWNTTGMKRRIYRTTGSTANWQLVAETTNTSYNDTLTDAQILGDPLITEGWELPPVGLQGLVLLPSGAAAGFVGNTLYLSEPYQLHAWPHSRQAKSEIVAIGVYGNNVALATTTVPGVASGGEPESMTLTAFEQVYPCVAKRSMVSIGNGCLYASAKGLILVSDQGASVYTQELFTEDEWSELSPSSMVGAVAGGQLYMAYSVGGVMRERILADGMLIRASVDLTALHVDAGTGRLYIAYGQDILEWDAPGSPYLGQAWMSREYVLPGHANLGAFRVEFQSSISAEERAVIEAQIAAAVAANTIILATGKAHGAYNAYRYNLRGINMGAFQKVPALPDANEATLNFYTDGTLRASVRVQDTDAYRLPDGYRADNFTVEVSSACTIRAIQLAETPSGLRAA